MDNTNITISYIVPVYNIVRYLPKCIDSIVRQMSDDDEIVLVDDGSTDESGSVCDEYARKFHNILVCHKKNGGLSDARNYGIVKASKQYILFLDGDDYLSNGSIDRLKQITASAKEDIQVVSYNAYVVSGDYETSRVFLKPFGANTSVLSGVDYAAAAIRKRSFNVCAWLYLCKRSFIHDRKLFFKEGILHEDMEWCVRLLLSCKKLLATNVIAVCYVVRENSITQKKDQTQNALDIMDTVRRSLSRTEAIRDKEKRRVINDYLLHAYLGSFFLSKGRTVRQATLSRKEVIKNAKFLSTRFMALAFIIAPSFYLTLNGMSKSIRKFLRSS